METFCAKFNQGLNPTDLTWLCRCPHFQVSTLAGSTILMKFKPQKIYSSTDVATEF